MFPIWKVLNGHHCTWPAIVEISRPDLCLCCLNRTGKTQGRQVVSKGHDTTSRVQVIKMSLAMAIPFIFITAHFHTEIGKLNKITRDAPMCTLLIAIALLVLRTAQRPSLKLQDMFCPPLHCNPVLVRIGTQRSEGLFKLTPTWAWSILDSNSLWALVLGSKPHVQWTCIARPYHPGIFGRPCDPVLPL